MAVYTAAAASPSAWPVLMETVYQSLPRGGAAPRGARRSDVSWSVRFFAAAVVAIPRKERLGAVTWTADDLGISRQTVYDISRAILRRLAAPDTPIQPPMATPLPPAVGLSHNELARAALTLTRPASGRARCSTAPTGLPWPPSLPPATSCSSTAAPIS